MNEQIGILINAVLHNELVLRQGNPADVTGIIETAVADFLERTKHDGMWCEEYLNRAKERDDSKRIKKYGDPKKGYHWQNVFLPNGTKLRITYRGKLYYAVVCHQMVIYQEQPCSPSQFVRKVANNTNRNAWRDIWVQLPGKTDWQFAETMRRAA